MQPKLNHQQAFSDYLKTNGKMAEFRALPIFPRHMVTPLPTARTAVG